MTRRWIHRRKRGAYRAYLESLARVHLRTHRF